jgi:hypothetical protein
MVPHRCQSGCSSHGRVCFVDYNCFVCCWLYWARHVKFYVCLRGAESLLHDVAWCAFWCFSRARLACTAWYVAGLAVKPRRCDCEASTLQACDWIVHYRAKQIPLHELIHACMYHLRAAGSCSRLLNVAILSCSF